MLETDTVARGQEHWCLILALSQSPIYFLVLNKEMSFLQGCHEKAEKQL